MSEIETDIRKPSPNTVESHSQQQAKRRMRKDIADRDRRIDELTAAIESQQDSNSALHLKIACFEKQLVSHEQRSDELLTLVDDQRAAIELGESQLKDLTAQKLELEQYVRELRRNGAGNGIPVPPGCDHDGLDVSMDTYLDRSMAGCDDDTDDSHRAAVLSPQQTPENLGRSVIDKQLREQQIRCQQLDEQLAKLTEDAASAAEEQRRRHADEMAAVATELRELRAKHEAMTAECQAGHEQRVQQLTDTIATMRAEHEEAAAVLQRQRGEDREGLADLLAQVARLNALNENLVLQLGERDVRIEVLGNDTSELVRRREQLVVELSDVRVCMKRLQEVGVEHERVHRKLLDDELQLRETANGLRTQLEMVERARDSLSNSNAMTEEKLLAIQRAMEEMRQNLQRTEEKAEQVQTENDRLAGSMVELRQATLEANTVREQVERECGWYFSVEDN